MTNARSAPIPIPEPAYVCEVRVRDRRIMVGQTVLAAADVVMEVLHLNAPDPDGTQLATVRLRKLRLRHIRRQ